MASLQQRNSELEAEVARLQTQIIELQQEVTQTEILSALVDFARTNPENSYKAAAIIGRDPSPFLRYVIIVSQCRVKLDICKVSKAGDRRIEASNNRFL